MVGVIVPHPFLSCPHLLRASMTTDCAIEARPVIMACRDKPGNDTREGWHFAALSGEGVSP